jgi:hypothetical protein
MTFFGSLSESGSLVLVGSVLLGAGLFLRRVIALFAPATPKQNSFSK